MKFEIRQNPGGESVFVEAPETSSSTTWFIDSVNGTNGAGYGLDRGSAALASLAYLITNASTLGLSAGDDIELAPNHNENIANAQIDIATASLNIYGHPAAQGSDIPTFDYDHANAEITLDANDIHLKHVNLRPSVTDVLIAVEMPSGKTGCVLEDVNIVMGEDGSGTDEFVKGFVLTSGNHDTVIKDCTLLSHASAAGSTHAIHVVAASNRLTIKGVKGDGPWATGGIVEAAAGLNHIVVGNSFDTTGTNYSFHGSSTFAERSGNLSAGMVEDTAGNIIGFDNNNNAVATTNVVANEDGSIVERVEQIQEAVNKGTGTAIGANKSLVDAIGSNGVAAAAATAATAVSLFGAIGTNEADATTPFSSSNVQANADGTVLEREEYIQGQANKIDTATLAVSPTAGSLATFVASGGTALGTALAASKSLIDALGTNGASAAVATAASAVSILGAIGTNEADATTPFSSANVQANADGTVLERQEVIQASVIKIDGGAMAAAPTSGSLGSFIGGGGTALGTRLGDSKSIVDAVGSTGLALAADSVSVGGFVSHALERCVEKSDGTCTNPSDNLFTITGGPILVTQFIGIVTDTIGNNAATAQIQIDVTAPAGTVNLSTAVGIDTDAIGTSYSFTIATPGVLTPTTAGAFDQVPEIRWLCPIGTIKVACSDTNTGTIKWYMFYKPLTPNAVVTAAA